MRLIDVDALKKDWSMANKCEECPQDMRKCQYEQNFTRMDICEMLDEAPTIGGWISVKDRLPNEDVFECLVVNHGETSFAYHMIRDGKHDFYMDYGDEIDGFDAVTHWMPLPEPPKEAE